MEYYNGLTCLLHLTLTKTVRELIGSQLQQQPELVEKLVTMCGDSRNRIAMVAGIGPLD